ncbi:recombinase family protein [Sporosarcina sp. E16_8]|uniref:recombinase family protein n=1 Tax=Sporosarcina sp. E16_8 TaxID=2789295 RepID=UPI001A92F9C8|nr:recombinase family protein [Sporosarcina sp. E16_8]MBO0586493.1 recombinase family protein [Sporosarcina sp. E16_8]
MYNVLRVAIYIRVSSKMQEGNFSLSAQTHELTKYSNAQGWEIVDVYKDADSGTKLDKDGLEAMLDAIEEGLVDIVLCIEQDRLSRLDTVKWEYLKSVLRDNDVKIAEPGSIVDLTNIDDEFVSDIKNLVAQRSRKDMLRKMARGIRQRTREGKVWGPQPEEYHYDKATGLLNINEKRAWIIPFIDGKYLTEELNPTAIARELNKRCKTAEGKEWTDSQVVDKLKRKAYHGDFERKFKAETITVPNIYPKLRTEETFNRIQAEIERRYNWKPAAPHILRGIDINCANCRNALTISKSTASDNSGNQEYITYTLEHSGYWKQKDKCSSKPFINVKRIQHNLKVAVKDILTDPEKAKLYIDSGFDADEVSKLSKEIKRLEAQKQAVQEKTDRLLDLYLDGKWSKERLDGNRVKLASQLAYLETDLKDLQQKRKLIQKNQLNYDSVSEFLAVAERFEDLLDVEDQQRLLGSLFPSATLDVEKELVTLHAYLPQEVTVDIKIRIDTTQEMRDRETFERSKIRHDRAQKHLNKHRGLTMKDLGLAVGHQPFILKQDQERFGPFKHLARHWSSPELRQERVNAIKKELAINPKASLRKLAEDTGIYRKMISKLIEEESLRP